MVKQSLRAMDKFRTQTSRENLPHRLLWPDPIFRAEWWQGEAKGLPEHQWLTLRRDNAMHALPSTNYDWSKGPRQQNHYAETTRTFSSHQMLVSTSSVLWRHTRFVGSKNDYWMTKWSRLLTTIVSVKRPKKASKNSRCDKESAGKWMVNKFHGWQKPLIRESNLLQRGY